MLVCHCNQICDRTIRESIRDGARSIDEVGRSCGAGTDCGGCRPIIGALLTTQRQTQRPDEPHLRTLRVVDPSALSLAG